MNSYIFDNLINFSKKNGSIDEKLEIMKIAIGASGGTTTSQVVQLMQFLPSDDDKLELAKTAYGYVRDPDYYYTNVGEAFSYDDTQARLHAFIHRY